MKLKLSSDHTELYTFSELDINQGNTPAIIQRVSQNPTDMHGHHDFVETVLILDGSCVHTTSTGEKYTVGAGDFFFIPKGTQHSYSDVDSLRLINILVRIQFMESVLRQLVGIAGYDLVIAEEGAFRRNASLAKDKLSTCLELAGRIEAETWDGGSGRDQMLSALLSEFFIKLFRFASASEGLAIRSWPDFGKLAEYMEDHIQKSASITAMAKAGGVSKRTLLRRFKTQTGMSPMECLTQMRLSKACRLLRESSMEIKHIAISCGFPDSNYFSRQYKKRLGVSPRQFRKANTLTSRPNIEQPGKRQNTQVK